MSNQYKKDIIACYKQVWELYEQIPSLELVLEIYKEMKSEDVATFAVDFYNDIGCYEEANRVEWQGLAEVDYDKVGFEEDSCTTDIDITLEEEKYTFVREGREIVNGSQIYLFGEEWQHGW